MTDITNQSLNEIIENVKTKKVSSMELTKAYIKNIESAKKIVMERAKVNSLAAAGKLS